MSWCWMEPLSVISLQINGSKVMPRSPKQWASKPLDLSGAESLLNLFQERDHEVDHNAIRENNQQCQMFNKKQKFQDINYINWINLVPRIVLELLVFSFGQGHSRPSLNPGCCDPICHKLLFCAHHYHLFAIYYKTFQYHHSIYIYINI